ncbi:E3 ubiquitin-protein ligase MARCH9 [Madurella mycetomatis]|uniref:E3 ubiquitin-protein ligase MARCH9 n=1 Tax=Madurella mycetomatis TaxID=100816 RepID=A0A175W8A0_9PEZI|nr:E3 ubiquitin-protein ligase MARCH9 [Madurella mycetomatis]
MASGSFEPRWGWPSGIDAQNGGPTNETPTPPAANTQAPGTSGTTDGSSPGPTPTQRQRHYKPRTCRICLEVVQPTTDIDDSLAGRVFSSKARVRYVSEDPELGRLLSPCKCKGSQKYVHEGCLRAWRTAAPLSDRNYWRCPTCQFQYRLERLQWGRWLSSKLLRAILTVLIMVVTVFFLGFVADPIINFWFDPFGSLAGALVTDIDIDDLDDEPVTWYMHFTKGFLSLGLLGFLKTMLAMSPWNWINVRFGGRRRHGTGRDRMESVNWALVVIGVITFLGATWKFVSHMSARVLENASDRVVDVQEDNPDDDEEDEGPAGEAEPTPQESRKDR